MNTEEYLHVLNSGKIVKSNSEIHQYMHALSQDAIRITMEINTQYHTPQEIISLFSRLTGKKVDPTFSLFPPFYTDCGKNIAIGKRVFINSGCKFQDQGGIVIGDDVLIGHGVVLATLNHALSPNHRKDMLPAPICIGSNVWIGSNSTILPGVTIGDNAVVAAGAVVTKNVPENTVVGGVPSKILRTIKPQEMGENQ